MEVNDNEIKIQEDMKSSPKLDIVFILYREIC